MSEIQEPFGDDLDFFDDGTGFVDGDAYWAVGVEVMEFSNQEDDEMAVVNTIVEGTDRAYLIPVNDPAGNPLDLTGEEMKWVLSELAEDDTPILVKVPPDGLFQIEVGMLKLVLQGADTIGLDGLYHQEVKATIGGLTKSLRKGTLKVIPSSTGVL